MNCHPPAKINLALRVLSRRTDGFHDIETLFQSIGLWDELRVELADDGRISLSVANAEIPADTSNLCYQAALRFGERYPDFPGCRMTLVKHIPHAAGLGGGSSDAASTLLLLNQLLGSPLSTQSLSEIALGLGSDVPFFLQGGTALATGRGEVLTPISVRWRYTILLVCPTVKISTPWAFDELKIGLTRQANCNIFHSPALNALNPASFPNYFANDFEELVFSKHQFLRGIKRELQDIGAFFASLSGTGSTVFGLFFDEKSARRAQAHFQSAYPVFLAEPWPAVEASK